VSLSDSDHRGLLPAGLADLLPPDAAREARAMEIVLGRFAAFGYERVKPPLVEFEESLLTGPGAALAGQTFRLMDPVSQRMMGVRPDMTVQVARIAVTRLKDAPRPLRLSYAGNVIRVRGTQLRPERQFSQVGAELIGIDTAGADAEAVLLAVDAVKAAGAQGLSVDLNLPTLVASVCTGLALPEAVTRRLRRALDRKDEAAVAQALDGVPGVPLQAAGLFLGLLRTAGPAEAALPALRSLALPEAARAEADRLAEAVALVRAGDGDLQLTVDAVEYRGLEYQTGVSFSVFTRATRGELARGGRYVAGYVEDGNTEPATGLTVYLDALLAAAKPTVDGRRLYVPADTSWSACVELQRSGWLTVRGGRGAAAGEARRLGCSHALVDGKPVPV
jgi:ATP phosphoribosyltransferase regulatory subunit